MAVFLSEADIMSLVSMEQAIEAVSKVFSIAGEGGVINPPRQQIDIPAGYLRLTSAIVSPMKKIAVKVSSSMVFKSNSGRLVFLIDSETGRVDALIEVFYLGQLRTAAASGVATDLLARPGASTVGIFGSGRQARTQLIAMAAVRPIEKILAISPNAARLSKFCSEMTEDLQIPVVAATKPEDLYSSAILISATTSKAPVIFGEHLQPGTHINAIGANRPERREVDEAVVRRCSTIVVDSKEQAKKESSALVSAVDKGIITWGDVREIGDCPSPQQDIQREQDAISLYNSHGVAMEDVALATKAFELAVEKGAGTTVPLTKD